MQGLLHHSSATLPTAFLAATDRLCLYRPSRQDGSRAQSLYGQIQGGRLKHDIESDSSFLEQTVFRNAGRLTGNSQHLCYRKDVPKFIDLVTIKD